MLSNESKQDLAEIATQLRRDVIEMKVYRWLHDSIWACR